MILGWLRRHPTEEQLRAARLAAQIAELDAALAARAARRPAERAARQARELARATAAFRADPLCGDDAAHTGRL